MALVLRDSVFFFGSGFWGYLGYLRILEKHVFALFFFGGASKCFVDVFDLQP